MRYVQTIVIPRDDGIHPVDRQLAEEPNVTRELVRNVSLLDDGTAVCLLQLSGDVDRVREIADTPKVLDANISAGNDQIVVYAHFEPTETLTDLLSLFREHELILDMPVEYTRRDGLRINIIGEESTIREVIPEVPDGIGLYLEQISDYDQEEERLYSELTERQQETLQAALEVGYYRVPREATHQDVADVLGRSDGTVGEHLRKIEAKVMASIVP